MLVYLLFCLGLVLLLVGGDLLVKGAVGLAEKFGISPLIIGLTIVALGTSAPELLISLQAALAGSGELAVGNVVGSNIANVLLVLGLPAIIASISSNDKSIHGTLFFLIGLTAIFMWQMYASPISRLDGLLLLLLLTAFLVQQFIHARRSKSVTDDYHDEIGSVPGANWKIVAMLVAGIIALPFGADLTVDASVEIARRWMIDEEVIGLTIIAIGTSLPELATGVMAARHNNTSVAIGNVVGSNFFNIAAIMGATAFIAGDVTVGAHIIGFDMWIMLASTLFLIALPLLGLTIGRKGGVLLLGAYFAYLVSTAAM
ncbi:MAG: calcium/sodium antiporter [Rhizobiaceae bacterium]|nr:calcium/sodium antiporter [Hyphomicrobiales bacterium]NRB31575.1 calcium/sodium antiporter [Rhizobiaceae bacterium]